MSVIGETDAIFQGYLVQQLKKGIFSKSKRFYTVVFRKSKKGMQRLEMYPSQEEFLHSQNAKIIKLKDCVSLKPLYGSGGTATLSFQLITFDNEVHQFGTENYPDLQNWLAFISEAAFPEEHEKGHQQQQQSAIVPTQGHNAAPIPAKQPASHVLENIRSPDEDYASPWDMKCFNVTIVDNQHSRDLELKGRYEISITDDGLILLDGSKIVKMWPYSEIHRIGFGNGTFFLETVRQHTCEFTCSVSELLVDKVGQFVKLGYRDPVPERLKRHLKQQYSTSYRLDMPYASGYDRSGALQPLDSSSPKSAVPVSRNASMKYWDSTYGRVEEPQDHSVYGNPDPNGLPGQWKDVTEEQMSIISESSVDPRRRSKRSVKGVLNRFLMRKQKTTGDLESTNVLSPTPVVPVHPPSYQDTSLPVHMQGQTAPESEYERIFPKEPERVGSRRTTENSQGGQVSPESANPYSDVVKDRPKVVYRPKESPEARQTYYEPPRESVNPYYDTKKTPPQLPARPQSEVSSILKPTRPVRLRLINQLSHGLDNPTFEHSPDVTNQHHQQQQQQLQAELEERLREKSDGKKVHLMTVKVNSPDTAV